MGDYLASLRTLRAREPRRIYPAHGPVRDDAVALIDEYIAHRLERERQVLDCARSGAARFREHARAIYPDLDQRLHGAAEVQMLAHLIKLQERRMGGLPYAAMRPPRSRLDTSARCSD